MSEIELSRRDARELNLAVAEAHFHSEANNEVDRALALFTDDVVWESPTRGLVLRGKSEAGANYRRMFNSFSVESFRCLQRFATEDRVVDDSVLVATLTGSGVQNAPAPVGSRVEIRLLHVFEMRDGKISKKLVFENWKLLQPAVAQIQESKTTVRSLQWT